MAATGCGSQKKSLAREQSGIKKLSVVYGRFLSQHRGQPPANEAEFKKYVQSLPPADLTSFGVDDSNRIFISDRDEKPYIIIYGQPKGPPGPGGSPVIAYEQEGKVGNVGWPAPLARSRKSMKPVSESWCRRRNHGRRWAGLASLWQEIWKNTSDC